MSQQIALFVSEQKLKSFTSINENVSPRDLVPFILNAQDIELQNYLGSTFYMQLKSQVLNNTLTAANQFLIDNYIAAALCNWGLMRALPFLRTKIYNKSVMTPTSDSSQSTTLEELKFLQEQCRSTAETYTKRMLERLILHPNDYPAYTAPSSLDGQLPDKNDPYFGGLVATGRPYAYTKRATYRYRNGGYGGYGGDFYGCQGCYDLPGAY